MICSIVGLASTIKVPSARLTSASPSDGEPFPPLESGPEARVEFCEKIFAQTGDITFVRSRFIFRRHNMNITYYFNNLKHKFPERIEITDSD
jgi:hypothetical protein